MDYIHLRRSICKPVKPAFTLPRTRFEPSSATTAAAAQVINTPTQSRHLRISLPPNRTLPVSLSCSLQRSAWSPLLIAEEGGRKGRRPKIMTKKRQKEGFAPEDTAGVSEATRIRISNLLEQFRASDDEVYTFEANLNNYERAVVHQLSRKMGMTSNSFGKGNQRHVSVYKVKKSSKSLEEKDSVSSLSFSEESKRVLMDLFMHYPPGEDEEQNLNKDSGNGHKSWGKREDIFRRPVISKAEISKKLELLASKMETTPKLQEIFEKRAKLPIASFEDVITSTIATQQVVAV